MAGRAATPEYREGWERTFGAQSESTRAWLEFDRQLRERLESRVLIAPNNSFLRLVARRAP